MMTGNTEQRNENTQAEITIFSGSVTGASHKRRGTVCQDASAAFSAEDGSFHIVTVADGHGDPSCVRSDRGSGFAVRTAVGSLQVFAECYPDLERLRAASETAGQRQVIRQLTNAIVSEWAVSVKADLSRDPLTEEEYRRAGRFGDSYRAGEHIERIYGSTLVAALQTKDYLLLLQQGDGRCDLLYDDLRLEQPVPEDERCYANVTTSLSDVNAAEEIRGCLVERPGGTLAACLVSTDGVDNGFLDDEDLLRFYLQLCINMTEGPGEDRDASLRDLLEQVSENGNGDDVSAAGVCRQDLFRERAEEIRGQLEAFRRERERDQYVSRMISLERKVTLLKEKVRAASPEERTAAMKEYLEAYQTYQEMEAQAEKLRS